MANGTTYGLPKDIASRLSKLSLMCGHTSTASEDFGLASAAPADTISVAPSQSPKQA